MGLKIQYVHKGGSRLARGEHRKKIDESLRPRDKMVWGRTDGVVVDNGGVEFG